MQHLIPFIRELYKEWKKDGISRHAAALAYYTIFALPALLLVTLSIVGSLLDAPTATDNIFNALKLYVGEGTAEFIKGTVRNIQQNGADASWAGTIGVLLLVVAASGIIRELQSTIHKILGHKQRRRTLLQHIWTYVVSLLLIIITAVVLIGSVISGTIINILGQRLAVYISVPVDVLNLMHNLISYVAMMLMIFFLYLFLPERRFPLIIVFLSSIITSSLLVTGTIIATYFISHTGLGEAYGVAAGVLVVLFWIYFGVNVFLFGAEIMDVSDRLSDGESRRPGLFRRILRKYI